MIATDGQVTVGDNNDYNLSMDEAAERLKNKKNVLAVGFPDFSQEYLESVCQEPVVLKWQDCFDLEKEQIIEDIRIYEQFGFYE